VAYARHHFALAKPVKTGGTVRAHLTTLAKRGHAPSRKKLVGPPLPVLDAPLWETFLALHRWRGMGGMSVAPLTLSDVEAWERRFLPPDTRLSDADLELVKRLDDAYLSER